MQKAAIPCEVRGFLEWLTPWSGELIVLIVMCFWIGLIGEE